MFSASYLSRVLCSTCERCSGRLSPAARPAFETLRLFQELNLQEGTPQRVFEFGHLGASVTWGAGQGASRIERFRHEMFYCQGPGATASRLRLGHASFGDVPIRGGGIRSDAVWRQDPALPAGGQLLSAQPEHAFRLLQAPTNGNDRASAL